MFCRLGALEISELQPTLAKANCRLVAVGLEEFGMQEFLDGGFFKGDVYLDQDKKSYKALGFKWVSTLGFIPALLARVSRDAMSRAKARGVEGNLQGDGHQSGGVLVVGHKGPKLLYEFKQDNPAAHPPNADILKALGLPTDGTPTPSSGGPKVECTDDVCTRVP